MISVIVAVYNVEKYLEECLESIVGQTFSDLEIILVDDGSTDSSGEICDKWAEIDKRINVLHCENGGAGAARNRGLDIASGDYILFCDSDDYYDKKAVQILFEALINNDADVVAANIQGVSVNREKLDISGGEIFDKAGVYSNLEVWDNVAKERWGTILLTSRLFKRGIWENVRFPIIKAYEDEAVFHLLMKKINRFAFIEDALYYYRQSEGSIMRSSGNYIKRLILPEILIPRIQYLLSKQLYNSAEYNYYKGIWVLAEASSKEHMQDHNINKRVRELRKEYRKISNQIIKHIRNPKNAFKFLLSRVSLRLYRKACLHT